MAGHRQSAPTCVLIGVMCRNNCTDSPWNATPMMPRARAGDGDGRSVPTGIRDYIFIDNALDCWNIFAVCLYNFFKE